MKYLIKACGRIEIALMSAAMIDISMVINLGRVATYGARHKIQRIDIFCDHRRTYDAKRSLNIFILTAAQIRSNSACNVCAASSTDAAVAVTASADTRRSVTWPPLGAKTRRAKLNQDGGTGRHQTHGATTTFTGNTQFGADSCDATSGERGSHHS